MDVGGYGQSGAAPKRLLIVEDDPVSALLLRKVLEGRGYLVDRAQNGVEALEKYREHEYRIVISDWMMPEMDGVTLCREFRALGAAYVYVILLSAKSQRADRLTAFEAGIDDFLTKPLDREELFARLKVAERILEAEDRMKFQKAELEKATEKLRVTNNNLVLASRRFEELFSGLPVPCFTFDGEGYIHEWNRAAETLFGIPAYMALLHHVWDKLTTTEDEYWTPALMEKVFAGESIESMEWVFRYPSGEERQLVCNIFPLRGPSGELLGAIAANLDITERKLAQGRIEEQMVQINEFAYSMEMQKIALEEANARLELLAVTDGLTGLWNHRRFQEELEACYRRHRESGEPLSVIFLDVDHFKKYNDTYGHPAGDEVLKIVAQQLREASAEGAFAARYGGEEFAILLPGVDAEGSNAAAERYREAIEQFGWPERTVTVSLGVATLDDMATDARSLLNLADTALYASKQGGRNRSTHANSLETASLPRRRATDQNAPAA
ncbi:MAG: diguanylate cyclase [Fimbriimonadaceae bacterium]|nr:diguanylate cyclase [Fimbriimonadaceae bacterium]